MATTYTPPVQGSGFKATVQRIGGYLAGMVMPNIGAFIAWGLITALFIPKGWTPNATIAEMVGPMITYLLPILIGYTGGRLVHGQRGAVVAAVATVGVVVGADVPMFLGAMLIGPAAAYIVKLWDGLIDGKIRPGFEMLVDNFSAGIIGAVMAIFGQWAIGPSVSWLADRAEDGVSWLIDHHLLGLVSILVEPGKVVNQPGFVRARNACIILEIPATLTEEPEKCRTQAKRYLRQKSSGNFRWVSRKGLTRES